MKQALIASLNHILNASFLKPSGHIETLLHMPANKKKGPVPICTVHLFPEITQTVQDADTASPIVIDRAGLHFGKQIESCLCLTTLR